MIVAFESFRNFTVEQACNYILKQKKKRLIDLAIFDFIIHNNKPLPFVHGLYMFFDADGDTCLYVGRVVSPQFIERIPAHFAVSEDSWLNQFLKAHKQHNNLPSFNDAVISSKDCQILIFPMPPEFIKEAEKLFILFLKPKYNKRRPNKNYYEKIPVSTMFESAIKILN